MSKHRPHNYTNYSKHQEPTPAVEAEVIEEVVEEVIEETVAPEPKDVLGVVTDCNKLNVRTNPSTSAEIVTEIKAGTKVMINEEESTADFYKICTEAGVEGFCMKKFITVEQ